MQTGPPDLEQSLDQAFAAASAKPEPLPRWQLALGGAPDLVTAATFWIVWSDPLRWGAPQVKRMELVVILEFFVIHASGFLGLLGGNRLFAVGLGVFYLLFVWGIATAAGSLWMLGAFAWLLASKLHLALPGTSRASKQSALHEQLIDWPFSVAAYLGSFAVCLEALDVPRLGITDQVFADAGLKDAGLFEDQPWQALATGLLYFALMGLWRMRLWRWFRRAPAPVLP